MIKKNSSIKIDVTLDENNIPEKIKWTAPDGGVTKEMANAMLLSLWDGQKQEALRIDLWIKEMPLDQMKIFFHQTMIGMGETYYRATQDEKMRSAIIDFCNFFAEKLDLK